MLSTTGVTILTVYGMLVAQTSAQYGADVQQCGMRLLPLLVAIASHTCGVVRKAACRRLGVCIHYLTPTDAGRSSDAEVPGCADDGGSG